MLLCNKWGGYAKNIHLVVSDYRRILYICKKIKLSPRACMWVLSIFSRLVKNDKVEIQTNQLTYFL